ncbi:hypothetical protein C5167_039548 [Papaver somniferum]|uniref:Uncharacterized protein n=1 Tax=Papaver somniferum TaxID=3469 RepID=A0A4Y7IGJ7_PAPSO|nr:uncharacterized protein LOC113307887 [Papaver somniferum]RZC46598.1 hypothetical protein C5167_039548 [Papaver somniferum]
MDLLSSTVSSLASSFKSEYKGEEEEEELDQLLDEYWFFENLFHRKEKNMLSTTDLWNSIQNHNKNIRFDDDEEEEEEKKKQNQFGVDDNVSSTTHPNDEDDDLPKEKDGGKFVRQSSLRTSPSLPPSLGRDKEIHRRSSSKLSRQYSLSSSKAVPQVHDSEFQYYKRQSSDPLYNNSMHNVQETVFENDQEMVVNKEKKSKAITNSSTKEISTFIVYNSLLRAPSLPPSVGRSNKVVQEKESNGRVSRLTRQASLSSSKSVTQESEIQQDYRRHSNNIQEIVTGNQKQGIKDSASITNSSKESLIFAPNLLRTPSLPPLRKEEESLRRSSKLSRQSSLTSSDVMPPINIPKIGPQPAMRSPGIPRHRSKKEDSSIRKDGTRTPPLCATKEVIRRSLSYKRSSSTKIDLEVEEVQGFKDLGFVFDTEQINESLANIIPGLQEKKSVNMEADENEKKTTRRPYLSEAWLVQPSKPTVPAWVDKRSAGDMKEQLKYWARSVASNVRIQEC